MNYVCFTAKAGSLELTDKHGRDALDKALPRASEESRILCRLMVPVELVEFDGMVDGRDDRDGNEMSKQGRKESSMIVNYVKVTPVCKSGGHWKNLAKGRVRSTGDTGEGNKPRIGRRAQRSIEGHVVSQGGKFLSKVVDNLGKAICARICNWLDQVADLRDP